MAKLRLSKALKKQNVSKRQLAKILGIQYNNVFRYFRPGYDPKFSLLVKIAKAIDVRVRDLIEE